MSNTTSFKLNTLAAGVMSCLLASAPTLYGAPGTLTNSPLFLQSNVEPNILFLLDDSGSMDWETMTRDFSNSGRFTGTQPDGSSPAGSGSVKHRDSNDDGNSNCNFGSGTFFGYIYGVEFGINNYSDDSNDCNTADDEAWRFRNSKFNPLYFDPEKTYVPWSGVDINGNPFTDVLVTAAPANPYNPGGETIDLTRNNSNWGGGTVRYTSDRDSDGSPDGFRYYTWTDTDGDGLFDDGEETEHQIKNEPADIQQNFANWFSYYRSRQLVAKAAYGQVIASTNAARMGLVTLHNNNAVNTAISVMNNDPASGAKRALLDALYTFQSNGGTPLRTTLNNAGRYLACETNNFFGTCPAIAPSNGGECQQNFTVAMTDGFYNGSFDLTNEARPTANNDDEDGNGNGNGDSNWDGASYADDQGNTLADIAMHYYETDLRSAVTNDVPTITGVDENDAQHMVTYTIAFGVDGTLTAMPTSKTDPFAWPSPFDNTGGLRDARRIDDLRHAAWNGRGEFLSAQNPQDLISGMRSALGSISGRTGSASSVAFNSGSLSTNSEVYLALFNSKNWSGDLFAIGLDPVTGAISPTATWSAATELDARNITSDPRVILTYGDTDSNDTVDEGVALKWANLTSSQKNDFRTNSSGTLDSEATGMARLGYIRGDRSCEPASSGICNYNAVAPAFTTKSFRERSSRLGDIIHSGPVFAGAPEVNWPDIAPYPTTSGETYSDYKASQLSRQGVIYVGGNDGMLHAFNQADGREILAYVPSQLYSSNATEGLHYLTDPKYTHRYYVDQVPTISDAYIKTTPTDSTSWKTILVGSLRGGGRGMFALDITNPSTFSESGSTPQDIVMWEFNNYDDPDLGYTFSRPSIVPLEGPGGTIKWAAIFGNGYNDTGDGEAKLFVLFLEGGLDGTWTLDSDYLAITTAVGDTSDRNGLATPAVIDSDGDGFADRVYAGDLKGNMWVFDLSGSDTTSWKSAYMAGNTPAPLFIAGSNQQITTTPVIVRNSNQPTSASNKPNTLVIFGTGQYLGTADITTTDSQSMYGIWDSGSSTLDRSDLVKQTISTGTTSESVAGRTLTNETVAYNAQEKGWYMDLPTPGERSITDPVIRGDLVFFNTTIPDSNPCNFGGTGWLMVAKWLNGGRPDTVAFDLNGDGTLNNLDEIAGVGSAGHIIDGLPTSPSNLGNKQYVSTTETTGGDKVVTTDIEKVDGPNTGRLSWEEVEL